MHNCWRLSLYRQPSPDSHGHAKNWMSDARSTPARSAKRARTPMLSDRPNRRVIGGLRGVNDAALPFMPTTTRDGLH